MKKPLILLFLMGLFTFTSCSDDDDNTPKDQEPILGTWFLVEANNVPEYQMDDCSSKSNITFKADNSASTEFYSTVQDQCVSDTDDSSTWSKSGSKYTFKIPGLDNPIQGTVTFNSETRFTFVPDVLPTASLVFEK